MATLADAVLWGMLAASGLLIGAAIAVAFDARLTHRIVAANMGFGGGVLIAVLSIDLMETAFDEGGPVAATLGFLVGALSFCAINWRLSRRGARNRNRCGDCVRQPSEREQKGSGVAIAIGSILDGIPESLVIGLSLLDGGRIGAGLVAGFFLANIPQGLSSAAGMKHARRSNRFIFMLWTGVMLASGAGAAVGFALLGNLGAALAATILAFSAGAVLAMLSESIMPESFAEAQPFTGLITVTGFLVAFLMIKAPG